MEAAIIHPQFGLGGGGEVLASRLAMALEDIGIRTTIYAVSLVDGDIDYASRIIMSMARVSAHKPPRMYRFLEDHVFRERFQRLKRLMLYGYLRKIAGDRYDLLIDTGSNMITT